MPLRNVFGTQVPQQAAQDHWQAHVAATHARTIQARARPMLSPRAFAGAQLGSPRRTLPPVDSKTAANTAAAAKAESLIAGWQEHEAHMKELARESWRRTKYGIGAKSRSAGPSPRQQARPDPTPRPSAAPAPPTPMIDGVPTRMPHPPAESSSSKASMRPAPAARNLQLARQTADALNSRFSNMMKAFKYVDVDGSGSLNKAELRRALDLWNMPIDDHKLDELISACDADGSGGIDYKEFVDVLARDTVAPAAMGKRGMQSSDAMGQGAFEAVDDAIRGHRKIKNVKASINDLDGPSKSIDAKALQSQAMNTIASRFKDIRQAFKYVDVDNSGTVDAKEIFRAFDLWNIPVDKPSIERLIKNVDHNGDGQINYDEFVDALARDTVAPAAMGKRGMQSKEAMGVGAFDAVDDAIRGHRKITNVKASINDYDAPAVPGREIDASKLKAQATDVIASRFKDIKQAFKFVDVDNTGSVDEKEIFRAFDLWNIPVDKPSISNLLKQVDANGDGQINYDEFVDALARDTVTMAAMGKRGMQSKEAMGVGAFDAVDDAIRGHRKIKNAKASINEGH